MDALKQQLLKVQQQLAGLSASQKMLTASLLVIMVMTIFYWSRFASTSEMEPVIDKLLSAQEIANLKDALANEGVKYEEVDGRIVAPVAKRPLVAKALSGMALTGKLPESYTRAEDTQSKGGLWESQADKDQRLQETRRARVEMVIRNWPNVSNVMVILTGEKRLGALNPDRPTASVSITHTGSASEARKYVEAARMQVAHAQVGLKPEDVGITLNGQAYRPEDPDSGFASGTVLDNRKQAEGYLVQSVREQLNYIPDVKVSVAVKMVTESSVSNARTYDNKNKVDGMIRQRTQTDTNAQRATGGEPGVSLNTGTPDPASAAAGTESNSEKTEIENQVAFGYVDTMKKTPGGDAIPQGVAVSVPATYYRRVWKDNNPNAGREPSADDVKPLVTETENRIRATVRSLLTLADDKAVSVGTFYPILPDNRPGGAQDTALAAIPASSGFGAKEIALGALAVISLFMVSMMVKKSAPQPVIITPPTPAPAPSNASSEPTLLTVKELAGEVGEADLSMLGQELDDDQLETRQVIEQVGTMVKQNPDAAANLIKRWLNQE